MRRISAGALTLAVLVGGLVAAPPVAVATVVCAAAEPVTADGSRSASLATGSYWYWHRTTGTASYVLQPSAGYDVDLEVYTADCVTRLCGSYLEGGATDSCTVTGGSDYKIRVSHFSGFGTYTITFDGSGTPGPALLGCDDGLDNDGDTRTDMADPGCSGPSDMDERGSAACDNGADDDGDRLGDYPLDPGCTSPSDSDERGTTACEDGLDNDGDGLADFPLDPGCTGTADQGERGILPCDDGVDNDGDGLADFPNDPGCRSAADPNETTIP